MSYYVEGNKRRGVGDAKAITVDQLGELITMGWKQAALNAGELFYASVGSFSTPVVGGGAGTIIDIDQPEFGIKIPEGVTWQPIKLSWQVQGPLMAADNDEVEVLAAVDNTAASTLDGTWVNSVTPINMKTVGGPGSRCTVKSVCNADTTDMTLNVELYRKVWVAEIEGAGASSYWKNFEGLYEPDPSPMIVGPATLFVFWGGTVATNAFFQAIWREIATTSLQNG